jgi:hypothetical protein
MRGWLLGYVAAGFVFGVLGHYYLYRVGLPIVPFIYQAF